VNAHRIPALLAAVAALVLVPASPALARTPVAPLVIVHSETVPLGASTLTASFTEWPLRADRSLDFTFRPAAGIEGRTGRLRAVAPSGKPAVLGIPGLLDGGVDMELPRHPRARDVWGLDVVALPEEGTWRFEFTVDGPGGTSTATMPLQVGPRPGPPVLLSWVVGMAPWLLPVPLLVRWWVRSRPRRRRYARTWSG
jgi:hypothetical protein